MSLPSSLTPLFSTGAGGAAGYQIERSLRFNSSDSVFLSRTAGTPTASGTWTFSVWVKRSKLGSDTAIFGGRSGGSATQVYFKSDNTIRWYENTADFSTTAVFRDVSSWYHFVFTKNGSSSCTIYVNGVQLQQNTASVPSTSAFNAGSAELFIGAIGLIPSGVGFYGDHYLADAIFVDGQALDPSSFGEFDANNVWQPKAYSGSYGTNGFHLDFADNSAATATALGKDTSGLGNNWTPNNFSVTQGTGSYTTNTTGTFAANRGAIKAFDGATSGSDFYAQPADGNTVTIGSLGITGITQLRMWLGKNNSGDPWGTLTLNATNVTSFLTTNYPSSTSTGQWIDLTSQLPGSTLSTITMTSPVANTDVRLSAVEVNGIVLIDRAASTTAGNDSLVDSPTNYGTDTGAGGEVRGNYATWNPLHANSVLTSGYSTLTNGNLTASAPSNGNDETSGTIGVSSGKWYFELTNDSGGNNTDGVGIADLSTGIEVIYRDDGNFRYNGSESSYGASWQTAGDVIGVAIDLDNTTIGFYKNGVFQGNAKTDLPVAIYNPFVYNRAGVPSSSTLTANFGQRPFAYTAPSGFKALCTANLPTPTIEDGSTVMDVKLYTGNGSTQTISGLNFSPDLVWIKARSAATAHLLFDQIRGATYYLSSNATDAESNSPSTTLTAFTSDGFTLGSNSSANGSSVTLAAWAWDAGTSTVSNTAGSITSQVRANASAGFSVVTYTGNGSAGATIGHGLGVAPAFLIIKGRGHVSSWHCYHSAIGNTSAIFLSSTSASVANSAYWNNTSPGSTTFTVGTSDGMNGNTNTYVAYCFSSVVGYSSFGSYTGNGSTDGPFVYTGFRPRWILIKNTSATADWSLFDTARDSYNQALTLLAPNLSAADNVLGSGLDILSNGFKLRRDASPAINASSNTFVYAAFAENPFQYARAR